MNAVIGRVKVLVPTYVTFEQVLLFPVPKKVFLLRMCFVWPLIYTDPSGYRNYDCNLYPHGRHQDVVDDFYAIGDSEMEIKENSE